MLLLLACDTTVECGDSVGPASAGVEGAGRVYLDADGDGFGLATATLLACGLPDGFARVGTDCDDHSADAHPGAVERCGGGDEDCDGAVDEAGAFGERTWYADLDGDDAGDPEGGTLSCTPGEGVDEGDDCDDADASISPWAVEACNGVDDDCDGVVDDADTSDAIPTWYLDADGDGYGDGTVYACDQPEGTSALDGDCDDADATVSPGAEERCEPGDEDCDGVSGDADAPADPEHWYVDGDFDGYGSSSLSLIGCEAPTGFVADAQDCDDGDAGVNPAALERCDSRDEDCDGSVDEDPVDGSSFYNDADGDGYGDSSGASTACSAAVGTVPVDGDCDDGDDQVFPDAVELCDDGVDQNCDTFERPCPLGASVELGNVGDVWFGETMDDRAGHSVGWAGDTDGDGLDEALIGAYREDSLYPRAGACYVIRSYGGGQSLLDAAASKLTGVADGDHTGSACDGAGDVDGDGLDDILVGAYLAGPSFAGAAYLVSGPAASSSLSLATATFHGEDADDQAGNAVRGAGDVDDDGLADVLIAAELHSEAHDSEGAAYLFYGPTSGDMSLAAADARLLGESNDAAMGRGIGRGADVDGDGIDDIVVGAPGADAGIAYLFLGPVYGDLTGADAESRMTGTTYGDQFGYSISAAPDANGDGYADVFVGASAAAATSAEAGSAHLFLGPVTGNIPAAAADASLFGEAAGDRAGYAVDAGGDLNADGYSDVLVGAWAEDSGGVTCGATYVELGPFSGNYSLGDTYAKLISYVDGVESGRGVSNRGDIDGDGLADIVVGAPDLSVYAGGAGGAFVLHGASFP